MSHPKGLRGTRVKNFADSEEIRDDTVYEVFCSVPFHIIEGAELLLRHVVERPSPPTFSFHFFLSLLSIWSVHQGEAKSFTLYVCLLERERVSLILLDHGSDHCGRIIPCYSARNHVAPRIRQLPRVEAKKVTTFTPEMQIYRRANSISP